ncbi:MAG: hypothetical protein AAF430_12895 [Myxococcota bacterium]
MNTRDVEVVVGLLKQIGRGEIDTKRAMESWPREVDECDNALAAVWHELSHFRADADVLSKDDRYAEWARERCRALAEQLEADRGR